MSAASRSYACQEDLDAWQSTWSHDKQTWCCAAEGVGCPKNSQGCETHCTVGDSKKTCGGQIQHAAKHRFDGKEHACPLAHGLVLSHCPRCSVCRLADAGCQVSKVPPIVTRASAQDSHKETPTTHSTRTTYDCEDGYNNWKGGWDDGKQAWCCLHVRRACPQTTPSPATANTGHPDCTAGFADWENLWDEGKQAWCCLHRNRACPVSSTTRTTTTTVPTTTTLVVTTTTTAALTTTLPAPPVPQGQPSSGDCANQCFLHGELATCEVRIVQIAADSFLSQQDPCAAAQKQLLQTCPACASCSLDPEGCAQRAARVLDGQPADGNVAVPAPVATAAILSTTTQYYDCDAGFSMWSVAWSKPKQRWCCSSRGRACGNDGSGGSEGVVRRLLLSRDDRVGF